MIWIGLGAWLICILAFVRYAYTHQPVVEPTPARRELYYCAACQHGMAIGDINKHFRDWHEQPMQAAVRTPPRFASGGVVLAPGEHVYRRPQPDIVTQDPAEWVAEGEARAVREWNARVDR